MASTKQNVLIPGAGGAAGIGAIKSLRLCAFPGKIVATDCDALSAGLYLADRGYVVPPANDPAFMTEAAKIIEKERITLILPTSGFDIVPYAQNKRILENKGAVVAMSDYPVIEICLDKLKLYRKLKGKFDLPYTTAKPSWRQAFPCIVKPVRGKGSRDVFFCASDKELGEILARHNDMIIQEYLPGTEYTIDVLSDLDGNSLVAIPRERIDVRAGISFKGKVVRDEAIQRECLRLAQFLGIKGPSCIQMKRDEKGVPKVIEVNPRMGGGTILTTYAGVNFPELITRMANAQKIVVPELREITMVRYYEEVILSEKGEVIQL